MTTRFLQHALLPLPLIVLLAAPIASHAQWLTQSIDLKAGWNAVFLHVDASHTNLNGLVAGDISNPILEVWRWNPPSVAQFTDNPAQPSSAPEWISWQRSDSGSSLQRLSGDSAYLVRVGTNVASYTWRIKGRPVAPRHDWTVTGLNLIGFPTVTNNPPNFAAFLAQAPELQSASPEIYAYKGGDLGSNNPALLPSLLFPTSSVQRGQAFWIRSGTVFNRYFGPFEVKKTGSVGVDFQDVSSVSTLRLRNLSPNTLTVTLRLIASETPPAGQPAIAAVPPLLLRGGLNLTNLTYGYTNVPVGTARTWTLAGRNLPGSEVEVVLGLNRSAIALPPGSLLAGVLRFTDSLGFSQLDMPVSATVSSSSGLWVGNAAVTQVGQYLKAYARDASNNPVQTNTGNYVVTNVDNAMTAVNQPYPLRLIVHNPDAGSAVLLQRVYLGTDAGSNSVVASGESALNPSALKDARRISSAHLPWTATNAAWMLGGRLGQQTNLSATVALAYDDHASNPFLHTYHPDHDNVDATFKNVLPPGSESYSVDRVISLNVQPPGADFSSLVSAARTLSGNYQETITFKGIPRAGGTSDTREFRIKGDFVLNRISLIPTLTQAP